jgi:SPP1 family predicted phage head-tail adaptor
MVGPGQRNRRVTLMQPTPGEDGYGQPLTTYSWVADVWADIRGATSREYTASRQTESAIDAVMRLPYRQDIQATWVVVYEGRLYDIQSQFEIGHREGIQLLTRERQP